MESWHLPNLSVQIAPDCISEYLNFQNFPGGMPPDPPSKSRLRRSKWALSRPYRPLSRGGHFESQGNKKLCFCTASLALNERLDVQNLLFEHCVIKVYCQYSEFCRARAYKQKKARNAPDKDGKGWRRLTRIANDEFEN